MTMEVLKCQSPDCMMTAPEVAYHLGSKGICAKVSLQGIPEWNAIARCMCVSFAQLEVTSPTGAKYSDLEAAAVAASIHVYSGKKRKAASVLQEELRQAHARVDGACLRRRSVSELQTQVRAAGGNPLPYTQQRGANGQRLRSRMSREAMEAFLAQ
jgi:hypothetical protein